MSNKCRIIRLAYRKPEKEDNVEKPESFTEIQENHNSALVPEK